jgi:hypothetical protein
LNISCNNSIFSDSLSEDLDRKYSSREAECYILISSSSVLSCDYLWYWLDDYSSSEPEKSSKGFEGKDKHDELSLDYFDCHEDYSFIVTPLLKEFSLKTITFILVY